MNCFRWFVQRPKHASRACLAALLLSICATAQTITTFAGNGSESYSGDGGPATNAALNYPYGAALDSSGNFIFADLTNNRVRKVDATTGVISTIAGNGTPTHSGDGGPATAAGIYYPHDVAVDALGNLYIAEQQTHRVRKVDAVTGQISTVAGTGTAGFSGDGGPATQAQLYYPLAVAVNPAGELLVVDTYNHRIRKVDTNGVISTIAGNGIQGCGGDGGAASAASMAFPHYLALDQGGNMFIANSSCNRIRRIDKATGVITTVAGSGTLGYGGDGGPATSAKLWEPTGVAVDQAGNILIADLYNHRIRKVDFLTGTISTYAGTGVQGHSGDGGLAVNATFRYPAKVELDNSGALYVSDAENNVIRKISPTVQQAVYVLNGAGNVSGYRINDSDGSLIAILGSPFAAGPSPYNITASKDGRFVFTANNGGNSVSAFTVDPTTGALIPASGSPYPVGSAPHSVAVDPAGKYLFVTNEFSNNISAFVVDQTTGQLTAVSGMPFANPSSNPFSLRVDRSGRYVYVANKFGNSVTAFKIEAGGQLSPIAGSPFPAGSGPHSVATHPNADFVYVANVFSSTVSAFQIDGMTGAITPVPGSPFSTDGGPHTVHIDPSGKYLYTANGFSSSISAFSIDVSTGALNPVAGVPFAGPHVTHSIGVDATLRFAYVVGTGTPTVSAYSVANGTGALAPIHSPFSADAGPVSLVIVGYGNQEVPPPPPSDSDSPQIACGTPDGLWHPTDVLISCTASDSGSGLSDPADAAFSLTTSVPTGTEFSNASTNSRQVCDQAGNCATAGPVAGNMVDKKSPAISITAPANAAYLLNQAAAAGYSCSDGGSGVLSCAGPVASGANFDTASVGGKTFTVNASDNVANSSSGSTSYSVVYPSTGLCQGEGGHQILQPINADGSSVFKRNSTVPAKFRVCDANGYSVSTAGVVSSFSLVQIISGTFVSNVNEQVNSTTPDSAFRWDSAAQQWIFNISTKSLSTNTTYVYLITLNDGSTIPFQFGLK